jgi:hypothetical protein
MFCSFIIIDFCNAQTKHNAVIYASYFGDSGEQDNVYIATDKEGNVIIAGHSYGTDMITKSLLQSGNKGAPDGFIAKFNPDMTAVIFSTYLGGSDYDEIKAVAVDDAGNIYITGGTTSSDFPVTQNALMKSIHTGGFDTFLTKLSPAGQILYSTFIGGSSYDFGMGISVIDTSIVCLAGSTSSADFPAAEGSVITVKGGYDVFIIKLDLTQDTIIFSKVIGGSANDNVFDIKTDKSGYIYTSGFTFSNDFPVFNAANSVYHRNQDGFIIKLDANGAMIYSRLIGGSGNDAIVSVDVNDLGEVYFFGSSNSSGLPCTSNAFNTNIIGDYDVIFGKLSSAGDSILYLSYFGGTGRDDAYDNGNNNIYHDGRIGYLNNETIVITGSTMSSNFPITTNAYDRSIASYDGFVSVLNIASKEVLYSTFLGGSGSEEVDGINISNDSTIFISGITSSSNFPVSQSAFRKTSFGGSNDALFARLILHSSITGVDSKSKSLPGEFNLYQNYPNPFNPTTNIQYSLNQSSQVRLTIYNILGQKTKTLVDSFQIQGEHSIVWNGTDDSDNPVSSGVYFYRLDANSKTSQNKMILIR